MIVDPVVVIPDMLSKKESIKESRTKIVEAIKAKADGHAQDIAGVEGEVERIAQLANYQN